MLQTLIRSYIAVVGPSATSGAHRHLQQPAASIVNVKTTLETGRVTFYGWYVLLAMQASLCRARKDLPIKTHVESFPPVVHPTSSHPSAHRLLLDAKTKQPDIESADTRGVSHAEVNLRSTHTCFSGPTTTCLSPNKTAGDPQVRSRPPTKPFLS